MNIKKVKIFTLIKTIIIIFIISVAVFYLSPIKNYIISYNPFEKLDSSNYSLATYSIQGDKDIIDDIKKKANYIDPSELEESYIYFSTRNEVNIHNILTYLQTLKLKKMYGKHGFNSINIHALRIHSREKGGNKTILIEFDHSEQVYILHIYGLGMKRSEQGNYIITDKQFDYYKIFDMITNQ